MKRLSAILLGAFVVLLLVVLSDSFFIVNQIETALVLQFGQPVRQIDKPGLQMKMPFTQSVVMYDRRVLDYELPPEEVIAADQKRVVVDTYTRYQITDPLVFYQAVGDEAAMQRRLTSVINASLRRVLGNYELARLLSPERSAIMSRIRDAVQAEGKSFGINIIDLRIRHADLPLENSQAIYARMVSEREREAKQFRAQGYEVAQGIRSAADRDRTVILADATKQAQILRGQGEGESIKIYADAFGQDPNFFAFYRSLQAYRKALTGGTTMLLSPDSDFLRFFSRPSGVATIPKAAGH